MKSPKQPSTIVLCGGLFDKENLPLGVNRYDPMTPVNGKPIISWILDNLIEKGCQEVTIVIWKQEKRLQDFLKVLYSDRLSLAIRLLPGGFPILSALQEGLKITPTTGVVKVLLGDTLIQDKIDGEDDVIFITDEDIAHGTDLVTIDEDSCVKDFPAKLDENVYRHAGFYRFSDGLLLTECVEEALGNGGRSISEVLKLYSLKKSIRAHQTEEVFHFGTLQDLLDARRQLLKPRHFNKLSVNPVLNTITKVSTFGEKLHEELDWCLNLPAELKVLAPRILSHGYEEGRLRIVQEYYAYPDLSDLYVFSDLKLEHWKRIIRLLYDIHSHFRKFKGFLEIDEIESMYIAKTWQRITNIRSQSETWEKLIKRPDIVFNGIKLKGILALREALQAKAEEISKTSEICVLHGDFSLQKILYDAYSQSIRLINPRGSFGRKGIYGDSRYDIAKLRMSVASFFEFMRAGLFDLKETDEGFSAELYRYETPDLLAEYFDELLVLEGYTLDEIKFIQGLLFITTVPMHNNNEKLQQMLFMTGLSLLNEVLDADSI